MKLKNIKNSFNDRKINPSNTAWDQLASRLDQEEKKSKKPLIYWLSAIAAIFVLGFVIYPLFNNGIAPIKDTQEMIVLEESNRTTPSKEINSNNELVIEKAIKLNKEVVTETETGISNNNTIAITSTTIEPSINKKSRTGIQNKKIEKPSINEAIAQQKLPINDNNSPSGTTTSSIEDSTINPELMNAVVQNAPKKLTAEEEMELLLNEALKNTTNREYVAKNINIDQLLRETEWDIQADRRNKVNNIIFDQLGKLKSEAYTLIGGNK